MCNFYYWCNLSTREHPLKEIFKKHAIKKMSYMFVLFTVDMTIGFFNISREAIIYLDMFT